MGLLPTVDLKSQHWLDTLDVLLCQEMSRPDLTSGHIAQKMDISRATLFRRVVELTGQTPVERLNDLRFETAKNRLESGTVVLVKELARGVGFREVAYFSRKFKERYGQSPAEMLRQPVSKT